MHKNSYASSNTYTQQKNGLPTLARTHDSDNCERGRTTEKDDKEPRVLQTVSSSNTVPVFHNIHSAGEKNIQKTINPWPTVGTSENTYTIVCQGTMTNRTTTSLKIKLSTQMTTKQPRSSSTLSQRNNDEQNSRKWFRHLMTNQIVRTGSPPSRAIRHTPRPSATEPARTTLATKPMIQPDTTNSRRRTDRTVVMICCIGMLTTKTNK